MCTLYRMSELFNGVKCLFNECIERKLKSICFSYRIIFSGVKRNMLVHLQRSLIEIKWKIELKIKQLWVIKNINECLLANTFEVLVCTHAKFSTTVHTFLYINPHVSFCCSHMHILRVTKFWQHIKIVVETLQINWPYLCLALITSTGKTQNNAYVLVLWKARIA